MTRPARLLRPALLPAALLAAGCAQQIQEAASDAYAPVFPAEARAETQRLATGAVYDGTGGLFASDRRAAQVGDVLTVQLSESFAATKSQDASSTKSDSFDIDLPADLDAGLDLTAGTDRTFSGSGAASQSNSLTGRVSVMVTRRHPGGLLEILGQKKLTLNNGDEYIRLSGLVREADISADNVVRSDRIANARIEYIGAGDVADTGRKGWLSRTLETVAPF